MKQVLIGLAGLARSGKTTAAMHLASTHNFQTYAFADPLREGLMTLFNLTARDFDDEHKEQPVDWVPCTYAGRQWWENSKSRRNAPGCAPSSLLILP